MIAVIDNYDSFTWNLVQYICELGAEVSVFRNDAITVKELALRNPAGLVISPGPAGRTMPGSHSTRSGSSRIGSRFWGSALDISA